MSIKSVLNVFISIILTMVSFGSSAHAADPSDRIDIEKIIVREVYEPGNGSAVGKICQVSGTVLIVHQAQEQGYRAEKDLDLFKGDTVFTGKDGNASFALNDGSFISLSPGTQMVINKSVYAVKQKTRSSFMNMITGKARFVVKKFVDARHSEFKVKTRTSVAGVRGSDFIINESETVTEITALEKTELEVISLSNPEAEPLVLHDFEQTTVRMGGLPEEAQKVKSEEVDRLMKEFKFLPSDQSPIEQEFKVSAVPVAMENIYVAEDDLIAPNFKQIHPVEAQANSLQDLLQSKNILMDEHDIEEQNTQIYQEKNETIQKRPLPGFPGSPE